jgi:hypothetical protein
MVRKLKEENFWVRSVDLKYPEFSETNADDFICADLSDPIVAREAVDTKLIQDKLHWSPSKPLSWGLEKTFFWIESQLLNAEKI